MRRNTGSVAALVGVVLGLGVSTALPTPFTRNSPAGGPLPSGVTEVGGIVADVIGANGV